LQAAFLCGIFVTPYAARVSITPLKIITDESCAGYHSPGHPERPDRILGTLEKLRSQRELPLTWARPVPADDEALLRAHAPEHIARLRVPRDFDADTPFFPDIEAMARNSAGAALLALDCARRGETAFSLMRPPGHHATRHQAMGFCYLNNVAIAARHAMATGAKRVAVFDFDVHHGNGTEDILLNQPGTAFYSVHEHPCYPGTGAANAGENCFNYPVAPGSTRELYRRTLAGALAELERFKPELIAVSAGFDAYARDPLANGPLTREDFHWIGGELRKIGTPVFSLLEGGYSSALPELILAYLTGIEGG
jgi:acetoin utilization deacetylase AcuC-like enzyme